MRLLLGLALVAAATAAPAHKPEGLKLKASDKDGAVAFKSQRYPDAYYLHIARLEQDGRASGFWRVPVTASFRIDAAAQTLLPGAVKLSALKLRPGRYVFKTLNQNAHWEGCLWAGTLAFDVKPGIVSYLGEIDFAPVKAGLVAAAGENAVARSIHHLSRFKEGMAAPVAKGPADAAALQEIGRALPKNEAPLEAQAPKPAAFTQASCW